MENTFWRGEALEKFEETIREENVMQTPQIDVAFERSFDGFVHTSENFLDLLQRKGRSEKGMNNASNCDDNSRTDKCENENNSRKNNFILSDEEINIKNSKLNIRISDSKSGCCYTNNSGPLYRKGTYSPKAEHLMSTSSSSSSSFSSSNAGEGGYQSKQDGGVILNPI